MASDNGFVPVIGVPLERSISYADDVFPWIVGLAQQGWAFAHQGYNRTDVARNHFAKHLLSDDRFTHLIMLDLDHRHPLNIIQRFASLLAERPDIKILSGLAYRRTKPYEPLMYVKDEKGEYWKLREWAPGAVISVDAVGTPCICIDREVFEALDYPYFWYDYREVAVTEKWITEDITFCESARAAGFRIYVDTRIVSPHLTPGAVDGKVFEEYIERFGEGEENALAIEEAK